MFECSKRERNTYVRIFALRLGLPGVEHAMARADVTRMSDRC
jgi:hypothetical protein